MTVIIAITKDRQPRSFRFQIRPGYSQPGVAMSRAQKDAAAARREAERVFGSLYWEDPQEHGCQEPYLVQVAAVQVCKSEGMTTK